MRGGGEVRQCQLSSSSLSGALERRLLLNQPVSNMCCVNEREAEKGGANESACQRDWQSDRDRYGGRERERERERVTDGWMEVSCLTRGGGGVLGSEQV